MTTHYTALIADVAASRAWGMPATGCSARGELTVNVNCLVLTYYVTIR